MSLKSCFLNEMSGSVFFSKTEISNSILPHGVCLKCHCSLITKTTLSQINLQSWSCSLVRHVCTKIWPSTSPLDLLPQAILFCTCPQISRYFCIYPPTCFTEVLSLCLGGHSFCVRWATDVGYKTQWILFLNMKWGRM